MATITELLNGLALKTIMEETSGFRDAIDELSSNTMRLEDYHLQLAREIRGNDWAVFANDGTLPPTAKQQLGTQTITEHLISIGNSIGIQDFIARDQFYKYGITSDMLSSIDNLDSLSMEQAEALFIRISPFMQSLGKNVRSKLRQQVKDLLANAGYIAPAHQMPLGLDLVSDAAGRVAHWNYSNKLASPADAVLYDEMVDVLGGLQKDVDNDENVEQSDPYIFLHSKKISIAGKLHAPNQTMDVDLRNAGDMVEGRMRAVKKIAVFGDSVHPQDSIMLGENHMIRRVYLESDPIGSDLFEVIIGMDLTGIRVTVRLRSIMVCQSPLDFVKSMVA